MRSSKAMAFFFPTAWKESEKRCSDRSAQSDLLQSAFRATNFTPYFISLKKALKLIFGLFIRLLDNASKFANPGEVKTALDMCQKAEEMVERKISN